MRRLPDKVHWIYGLSNGELTTQWGSCPASFTYVVNHSGYIRVCARLSAQVSPMWGKAALVFFFLVIFPYVEHSSIVVVIHFFYSLFFSDISLVKRSGTSFKCTLVVLNCFPFNLQKKTHKWRKVASFFFFRDFLIYWAYFNYCRLFSFSLHSLFFSDLTSPWWKGHGHHLNAHW